MVESVILRNEEEFCVEKVGGGGGGGGGWGFVFFFQAEDGIRV